jgi:aryl-alcohol dehydrogenase-like predicted oxidoreductase
MNFKSNKVNTKVSPECYSHPKLMVKSVENSLLKTKQTKFNTVYLHGGEINNSSFRESITEGLLKIKELELCENIGVSCYTEDEILKSSQNFPIVQAFQIPENILDQRLKNSNEVMNLSRQGIKFEIRSVFLQGSLLINNNQLPSFLIKYKTYYENLVSTANNLKISVFDLALNYVMSIPWKSSIVVGVNNFDQFEKLTSYQYLNYNLEKLDRLKAPQDLSDPRNWKI